MTSKKTSKTAAAKPYVLITTERWGVFVGHLNSYDKDRRAAVLTDSRMVLHWGTTGGVLQLAATGPTGTSKVSPKVPDAVRYELIECVAEVSCIAEYAWKALP